MLCVIFIIVTSPQYCDVLCVAVLLVFWTVKKGSASAGDLHRCRVFCPGGCKLNPELNLIPLYPYSTLSLSYKFLV